MGEPGDDLGARRPRQLNELAQLVVLLVLLSVGRGGAAMEPDYDCALWSRGDGVYSSDFSVFFGSRGVSLREEGAPGPRDVVTVEIACLKMSCSW